MDPSGCSARCLPAPYSIHSHYVIYTNFEPCSISKWTPWMDHSTGKTVRRLGGSTHGDSHVEQLISWFEPLAREANPYFRYKANFSNLDLLPYQDITYNHFKCATRDHTRKYRHRRRRYRIGFALHFWKCYISSTLTLCIQLAFKNCKCLPTC